MGATWLMTTSAAGPFAWTRSPAWTSSAPVRPAAGAAIFVYCRFRRAAAIDASSPAVVPLGAAAVSHHVFDLLGEGGTRPEEIAKPPCLSLAFFARAGAP